MGNTLDKIKGKLKKAEGEATDDKLREAQGWAEEKKADAADAIERASDKVEQKIDEVRDNRDSGDNKPPRP